MNANEQIVSWTRVERGLDSAHDILIRAKAEEDFQAVGVACREVIISLAQSIFDPSKHTSEKEVSATDANGMLTAYFSCELSGGANEELRAYAKACLKVAVALGHKRTARARDAGLALEATKSLVNLVGLVASREDTWLPQSRLRDRKSAEWEFMVLMLSQVLYDHPLSKAFGFKTPKWSFVPGSVSVTIRVGENEVTATVERHQWWKPATSQAAAALVDEILLRALALLPRINGFSTDEGVTFETSSK
jgi:hypothetical protein